MERPIYKPVRMEFPRRDEMETRLKAVGQTIHSPGAWYREDITILLTTLDFINTELHNVQQELAEKEVSNECHL